MTHVTTAATPPRRHGPGRLRPALVLALALGPASFIAADAAEECASAVAYTSKQKKAARERLILEAKQQALHSLAQRAWSRAVGLELETRSARVAGGKGSPVVTEDLTVIETLRIKYQVDELLQGYDYRIEEPAKHNVRVTYCVPLEVFEEAKRKLKEQREESVQAFRDRFAALDDAMHRRDFDYAVSALPTLKIEVENEVLSLTNYVSKRDGKTQTFRAWLLEWDGALDKGTGWARYLVGEAGRSIVDGHLGRAEQYLDQAAQADRMNPAIHNMRRTIETRRAERRDVLARAEELAAVGRFSAADAAVSEAERMDLDDPRTILQSRRRIEARRVEYLAYNPRLSGVFSFTVGSLGADVESSGDLVREATGLEVSGGFPLSFGAAAQMRVGRVFLITAGGSYGSTFGDPSNYSSGEDYIDLYQLSTGVGFATPRTARRSWSIQMQGGWAWESVDAAANVPDMDTSDSRTGLFARIGVEWRHLSLFAMHGFGFDDDEPDPDSVIAWSDGLLVGAAFVF